ncbi:MAG: 3-dehydroquinate synthase [Eubacteriales bacterium]
MKLFTSKYDILIETGALSHAGEYAADVLGKNKRVVIVSDDKVEPLYGGILSESLANAGFEVCPSFVFPHGEASKNMQTLEHLLNHMADCRLTRTDVIFALGGGVVGDLTGFAAAVYLRGIRYVQIPTSLIAATDSSVGGKTAVDLASGKNQAGAFHEPALVLCDPSLLATLPELYFSDGMAEVIKYGFIGDQSLLDLLTVKNAKEVMDDVIAKCVQDKIDVVSRDLRDTGIRQCLNLGHTVGHAVEALSDYSIPHGHAVAIGMAVITRAAVRRGLCGAETLELLLTLLKKYGLPCAMPDGFTPDRLFDVTLHDKKMRGGTITLVVPVETGKSELIEYPADELRSIIKDGLA